MLSVFILLLAGSTYHHVRLDQVATTSWTHVCTVGPVVYVRAMDDGDWHLTLDDGRAKVVAEIVTQIPVQPPRKGDRIRVCGITRWDKRHAWPELRPVTQLTVLHGAAK